VGVEGFGPPPLSGVASKATAFCQFRHTPIKNDPKLVLMEQDWDLQKQKTGGSEGSQALTQIKPVHTSGNLSP